MTPNAVTPRRSRTAAPISRCRPRGGGGRLEAAGSGVGRGGQIERRILGEDALVQLPEPGARLDPDPVDERRARVAVGLERLRLPPATVEREHPLAVDALAQRVLGGQRVQLADHLGVATGLDVGVDRHLGGAQAQPLEAAYLGGRERLLGEVGQRRPRHSASASRGRCSSSSCSASTTSTSPSVICSS